MNCNFRGERPISNINMRMIQEKSYEEIVNVNIEHGAYLIDEETWKCLKEIYGSNFTLKRCRNKEIRAYSGNEKELIIRNQKDLDSIILIKLKDKLSTESNPDASLHCSKDSTETTSMNGQSKRGSMNTKTDRKDFIKIEDNSNTNKDHTISKKKVRFLDDFLENPESNSKKSFEIKNIINNPQTITIDSSNQQNINKQSNENKLVTEVTTKSYNKEYINENIQESQRIINKPNTKASVGLRKLNAKPNNALLINHVQISIESNHGKENNIKKYDNLLNDSLESSKSLTKNENIPKENKVKFTEQLEEDFQFIAKNCNIK